MSIYGIFKKKSSISWKNWVQNPSCPMSIRWPCDVIWCERAIIGTYSSAIQNFYTLLLLEFRHTRISRIWKV